jgi:hypothetical protein
MERLFGNLQKQGMGREPIESGHMLFQSMLVKPGNTAAVPEENK